MSAMCDGCSLSKNRDEWAKYAEHISSGNTPDMMDLCKMCHSFQEAINNTIKEQKKIMDSTLAKIKRADKKKG